MDFHKGLNITVEDVKKAHMADQGVQGRYGVIYHQFWANEEEGTVFCLMEGPDKESCAAVHREAHGNVACSIVEVSAGFYRLFMGESQVVEHGLVKKIDGTPDLGFRNILVVTIYGVTTFSKSSEYTSLRAPREAKDVTLSIVSEYMGREVQWLHDDSLVAVFDSCANAVEGGLKIQQTLLQKRNTHVNHQWNVAFKIGLCIGQPVTEKGAFFSDATMLARRLCSVANENELLISSKVRDFCSIKSVTSAFSESSVRILSQREEDFISSLFAISEEKLSDDSFTVETLSRRIGMSRPQLYRKITSLTGKSPNDFLRDLRMDKALSLIKKRAGNISEIALEVGYNNPSYFAKCFQVRFGCTPSRYVEN